MKLEAHIHSMEEADSTKPQIQLLIDTIVGLIEKQHDKRWNTQDDSFKSRLLWPKAKKC